MTSLALMITAMIRYSATTVAYVADYGKPCRVDMGNVGLSRDSPYWESSGSMGNLNEMVSS